MKGILSDIKDEWCELPNSRKFWITLFWIAYITIFVLCPFIVAGLSLIGSIILPFRIMEMDDYEFEFWHPATLGWWVMLGLGLLITLLSSCGLWIYNKTIKPFNDFLNRK